MSVKINRFPLALAKTNIVTDKKKGFAFCDHSHSMNKKESAFTFSGTEGGVDSLLDIGYGIYGYRRREKERKKMKKC